MTYQRRSVLILDKGSLPVQGRPEEWAKWTAKSWRGMRAYDKIPAIDDANDIGLAVTQWWSSIQPHFRASNETLPLEVYSDPNPDADEDSWVSLRKSGPNGFVAVIMLLVWWGHAASTDSSEWQEDSLPLWKRVVRDVSLVVDEMTRTLVNPPSPTPRKRDLAKENEGASTKKRYIVIIITLVYQTLIVLLRARR